MNSWLKLTAVPLAILYASNSSGSELTVRIKELVSIETGVPKERLSLGSIDRRLNIVECSTGLLVEFPFPNNLETVKVSCTRPRFNVFLAIRYDRTMTEITREETDIRSDGYWTVNLEVKAGQQIDIQQIEYSSQRPFLKPNIRHPLGKFATNPTLEIVALKNISPGQSISFGDLKTLISIPKLIKDVGRGVIINKSMVALEKIETTAIPNNVVLDLEAIIGRETVRPVRQGQLVTETSIREANLVVKNQPVVLLVKSGALEIRVSAIARESGTLGEIVEVTNAESGKIILGEVLGRNTVGVQKNH